MTHYPWLSFPSDPVRSQQDLLCCSTEHSRRPTPAIGNSGTLCNRVASNERPPAQRASLFPSNSSARRMGIIPEWIDSTGSTEYTVWVTRLKERNAVSYYFPDPDHPERLESAAPRQLPGRKPKTDCRWYHQPVRRSEVTDGGCRAALLELRRPRQRTLRSRLRQQQRGSRLRCTGYDAITDGAASGANPQVRNSSKKQKRRHASNSTSWTRRS